MVSGPASRPAVLSLFRSCRMRSTVAVGIAVGIAVGLVCGRLERGSNAASPSAR